MTPVTRPKRALPPDIPPEAIEFLEEVGYLEQDTLKIGDSAPDVPLFTPGGEDIRLRDLPGRRPVVLIFGSHT
jgi:peroxiredoxin